MGIVRQGELFGHALGLPPGFTYAGNVISPEEQRALVANLESLPFKEFEFVGGYKGKRRVVSFGWRYQFNEHRLERADDIPDFLQPLRKRAAELAGLNAQALQQVLVTEYAPGAGIGWHKDRPVFGEVVGLSLLSPCKFRLRRKTGAGWQRASIVVEPRSAYVLNGEVRDEWEHSIPAMESLRYSVTFRKFRDVV
jgi:alkylated DNA repair dioxygenase AlkB